MKFIKKIRIYLIKYNKLKKKIRIYLIKINKLKKKIKKKILIFKIDWIYQNNINIKLKNNIILYNKNL